MRYLLDYAQVFDDADQWFDSREADEIVRTISELKILDPAVGSGAFPVGILHKLTLALRRLDPDNTYWEQLQRNRAGKRALDAFDTKDDQTRSEELLEIDETFKQYRDSDFGRKLYLIQNSIFGVDIQPVACQIAKLRFFISLAIEQEPDREADNFGIKPLPNLETRFIAVDTLIGLEGEQTLISRTAQALERELSENRERHFHATTRPQKLACKREDERLRRELATELRHIGMPTNDAEKIAAWDLYDQNASADWFDAEWMFGIIDEFDVVIGNPPYIQLQKDGGRLGRLYEPCNFDSFTRTGDIYCLFYEKANQLLKAGGHACLITSNKWMRAAYGKKLRDYFIEHTQPVRLLDMGPDVFDATVDTNILLLQNAASDVRRAFTATTIKSNFDTHAGNIAQYLNDNGVTMELPSRGEPWAILSLIELALKRKIEEVGKPLKDWDINIYRGIITGCNEAFVIDEAKREELIAQDPRSAEIIKPFLRGRDIKRYHIQWAELYVLATGYDLDIPNDYPAIYNHLETIGERIESRETRARRKGLFNRDDQGENWWNLRACAYYSEFEQSKIIYPDIYQHPSFTVDTTGFYCGNTCYFIPTEETWICGLLNARSVEWFYSLVSNSLGGGALRGFSEYIKQIPIPNATTAQKTSISKLVDQILDAKHTDPDANVCELENQIDQIVYLLYDLTPEEIAIVEEAENV